MCICVPSFVRKKEGRGGRRICCGGREILQLATRKERKEGGGKGELNFLLSCRSQLAPPECKMSTGNPAQFSYIN